MKDRALGLIVALTVSIGSVAQAAIVSWDLDIEFSGATPPAGVGPWLRVTLDDGGGSGSVNLTLTALNLVNTEFVRLWYLNLDPALDPNDLVFSAPTKVGTFADPVIDTGVDAFQADGDGMYDIEFAFANAAASRFDAGESISYTITGIPSLTANSFDFLSLPAGGNGPFVTAAHVQGIGATGDFSGWITQVPEPATIGLVGLSVLPLLRRRRLR